MALVWREETRMLSCVEERMPCPRNPVSACTAFGHCRGTNGATRSPDHLKSKDVNLERYVDKGTVAISLNLGTYMRVFLRDFGAVRLPLSGTLRLASCSPIYRQSHTSSVYRQAATRTRFFLSLFQKLNAPTFCSSYSFR